MKPTGKAALAALLTLWLLTAVSPAGYAQTVRSSTESSVGITFVSPETPRPPRPGGSGGGGSGNSGGSGGSGRPDIRPPGAPQPEGPVSVLDPAQPETVLGPLPQTGSNRLLGGLLLLPAALCIAAAVLPGGDARGRA